MTSQIRSHIEYLIQTYNILVLILYSKLIRNVAALAVFNTISWRIMTVANFFWATLYSFSHETPWMLCCISQLKYKRTIAHWISLAFVNESEVAFCNGLVVQLWLHRIYHEFTTRVFIVHMTCSSKFIRGFKISFVAPTLSVQQNGKGGCLCSSKYSVKMPMITTTSQRWENCQNRFLVLSSFSFPGLTYCKQ